MKISIGTKKAKLLTVEFKKLINNMIKQLNYIHQKRLKIKFFKDYWFLTNKNHLPE